MRSDDDDVVATRVFDRDDGDILLLIHKPEPYPDPAIDAVPDDPPWRCWITLRFPDGEIRRRYAVGIDAVQALLLAIAAASHSLRYVGDGTPKERPRARWLGEDDLGLSIRHHD